MPTRYTHTDRELLATLADEAWQQELDGALSLLYDKFCDWADDALDSEDLLTQIDAFRGILHRDFYRSYSHVDAAEAVARAIAIGVLSPAQLPRMLLEKLQPQIDYFAGQRRRRRSV